MAKNSASTGADGAILWGLDWVKSVRQGGWKWKHEICLKRTKVQGKFTVGMFNHFVFTLDSFSTAPVKLTITTECISPPAPVKLADGETGFSSRLRAVGGCSLPAGFF